MGGVTASTLLGETWVAVSVTQRLPWHPILFIPDSHSMTHEARGILPSTVPVSDAVANIGRTALLSHALRDGRADLMREAMRDTLHQPYRAKIFPHLNPTIDAAIAAGAHGAALSGAGPTVLALADADRAAAVAGAMQEAAMLHGIRGTADVSTVASRGVHILR
jgi:homoserine kinase